MAIVCLTGWLTAPLLPAPIAVLFLGTLPLVAVILSIVVGPTAFGASMEVRRRFTWTTVALVACFVPWAIVFGGWLLER